MASLFMFTSPERPLHQVVMALFLALGVVLGASFTGGVAAVVSGRPPIATIQELARTIKLWAIAVAIGGSFPTIQALETGLLAGRPGVLAHQVAVLLAGLAGAQLGQWIVTSLTSD